MLSTHPPPPGPHPGDQRCVPKQALALPAATGSALRGVQPTSRAQTWLHVAAHGISRSLRRAGRPGAAGGAPRRASGGAARRAGEGAPSDRQTTRGGTGDTRGKFLGLSRSSRSSSSRGGGAPRGAGSARSEGACRPPGPGSRAEPRPAAPGGRGSLGGAPRSVRGDRLHARGRDTLQERRTHSRDEGGQGGLYAAFFGAFRSCRGRGWPRSRCPGCTSVHHLPPRMAGAGRLAPRRARRPPRAQRRCGPRGGRGARRDL